MFVMLIRKDFRLQLPVLIAAAILFIAPLVIVLIVAAVSDSTAQRRGPTVDDFIMTFLVCTVTGSLVIPVFMGVAAARERRDRSGEFLEAMPVPRSAIVLSRAVVAFVSSLLPLAAGLGVIAVLLLADSRGNRWASVDDDVFETLRLLIPMYICAGGVSWLLGSIGRSEVLAASLGLGTAVSLQAVVYLVLQRLPADTIYRLGFERDAAVAYIVLQLCVAVPCLVAGTVIALRRTSP